MIIPITATTVNPTKGTVFEDSLVEHKQRVRYDYFQETAGTSGTGTYILPLNRKALEIEGLFQFLVNGVLHLAEPELYNHNHIIIRLLPYLVGDERAVYWGSNFGSLSHAKFRMGGTVNILRELYEP